MAFSQKKESSGQENIKRDPGFWILPYGNMMTILMIFFMILYSFTYIGKKMSDKAAKYEKGLISIQKSFLGAGDKKELEKLKVKETEIEAAEKIKEFIESNKLSNLEEVEINARRIKIRMKNPILFDLGAARLKEKAREILSPLAQLIKEIPNSVIVEGHTDNIPVKGGRYSSNWELSAARAFSVIKYFINEENISPDKLSAVGAGEYRPRYPNDTEENRAKNRRIEINIIRKGYDE